MKNIKKFTRNEDIISYSFNKQMNKQQIMENDTIQQTVKTDPIINNENLEGIPLYGFSGKGKNTVYSQYNENSGYFVDDNKNYNYNKYNDSTGYFK